MTSPGHIRVQPGQRPVRQHGGGVGGGAHTAVLYYIVLYCTVQVPIQLLPGEGDECGGMQQPRTEPSMVEMFEELAQIAVIKVAKYLVDNI